MRETRRLFGAAFLTDGSLYLAFAALPFRAIELGAGPGQLGILPTLYALAYMSMATVGGRLSDRVPRLTLARGGGALFLLGCLGLAFAPTLPLLFCALPVLGLGLGFFWSPVQASVSDRAPSGQLARSVSYFNICWSAGKGSGLLCGGLLTEAVGAQNGLLLAGFPTLITLAVLPRGRKVDSAADRAREAFVGEREAPGDPRFLWLAWLTNAIAFGVGSTMNVHAPKLLLERGAGPTDFGFLLGTVLFAQTATFALLARHTPGVGSLRTALGVGAAAVLLFLALPTHPFPEIAAAALGVALGVAYHSSIHTSLDRAKGRGSAAGMHETLLGAGSSSIPLMGGLLAEFSGRLSAPFLLAAAAMLVGLVGAIKFRGRSGHFQARS